MSVAFLEQISQRDPYAIHVMIWDMLGDELCDRSWKSLDELVNAATRWLREFWARPDQILSLVGAGWMRSQANA